MSFDSLIKLFLNKLLVTSVRVLRTKLVLTPMPVCFGEVVLVTNTKIISHQQGFELTIVFLWGPSIVFHAKWNTYKALDP